MLLLFGLGSRSLSDKHNVVLDIPIVDTDKFTQNIIIQIMDTNSLRVFEFGLISNRKADAVMASVSSGRLGMSFDERDNKDEKKLEGGFVRIHDERKCEPNRRTRSCE